MTAPEDAIRTVSPGPEDRLVRAQDGAMLTVPPGWVFVPAGDPMLTRRLKGAGPVWCVVEKRGRKSFARGLWAPADTVARVREGVAAERDRPEYGERLEADRKRRERREQEYRADFRAAVRAFLAFHPSCAELADALADAITTHAAPVGSGTVARTARLPLERKAEAAVIAWLRHQTTAYDRMTVARIKGERRRVRREIAAKSRDLLERYRRGDAPPPGECLLARALGQVPPSSPPPLRSPGNLRDAGAFDDFFLE